MYSELKTYQNVAMKAMFGVVIIFLISACDQLQSGVKSNEIASVYGESLTVDEAITTMPRFYLEQDSVLAILQFRDQWVEDQIAANHARELGLDETEDFRSRMKQLETDLLKMMLREAILSENRNELSVTDEEAQQYYQNNRDQFLIDERYVRFRHITTRTRVDAENANQDLMNGVEWTTVLENYSVDPDYQQEFSEQFWPESLVLADYPQLREYLGFIGITERSPITYENGNFHFIQLTEEITSGEYPDLDWLIPQIKEWLAVEKSRRLVSGYLRNLYLQAESNNEIESADVDKLEELLQYQFRDQ
jgi:hypothetical protein